jgi:hypothetical protein
LFVASVTSVTSFLPLPFWTQLALAVKKFRDGDAQRPALASSQTETVVGRDDGAVDELRFVGSEQQQQAV